jgi:hypothetical protein
VDSDFLTHGSAKEKGSSAESVGEIRREIGLVDDGFLFSVERRPQVSQDGQEWPSWRFLLRSHIRQSN